MSWLWDSQVLEKDVRHFAVEVLASMDHHLFKPIGGCNGTTHRRSLDELRTRTDHSENLAMRHALSHKQDEESRHSPKQGERGQGRWAVTDKKQHGSTNPACRRHALRSGMLPPFRVTRVPPGRQSGCPAQRPSHGS